jgi:hypothetical protein
MEAKTQENKTIEIRGPKNTDRRKPRRSDRRIYTEINSALTPVSGGEKTDEIGRLENRVFGRGEAGPAGGCSGRRDIDGVADGRP